MLAWAVLSPLLGFLIAGLFGYRLGDRGSQFVTCGFMMLATLFSGAIGYQVFILGQEQIIPLFTWIEVGDIRVSWAFQFNALSALMMMTVSVVSLCVHIYSVGYMAKDATIPRFMSYLSLFTFMMMMLVSADNLIQLFFGWEGVGLTSYLLIGYWYSKDSANAAAIKAFLVNRVGDFAFVLGLALIYITFQTFDITTILAQTPQHMTETFNLAGLEINVIELIAILLFIGAMGKSAQLGLHTWLPDAMEGPTPVSALIHAATMVTAGVFLVVRMSPLYELAPIARDIVTVVGASTAFFAGTIALTQFDIKRVIAYSTCSQLGYMFFAAGVSAYSAAMFHLVTHAFFKALLFLGSGSVIHAMSDEHDIRKMGGIWNLIPQTYAIMWIGSLALAGIPFFAGYYSKDLILESTWLSSSWTGQYALILGLSSVFLTAFYSWRLLWLVFHGKPRADERVMAHIHEAPPSMMIPLFILALGSIFGGYIPELYGWFSEHAKEFWAGSIAIKLAPSVYASVPHWLPQLATLLGISGIMVAILFYTRLYKLPKILSEKFSAIYTLFYNKWYFDELYDYLFVRNSFKLGQKFWQVGDQGMIDGYGPDGFASWSFRVASRVSQLQSGYIFHYAFAMASGVVLLGLWYLLVKGG